MKAELVEKLEVFVKAYYEAVDAGETQASDVALEVRRISDDMGRTKMKETTRGMICGMMGASLSMELLRDK